jgi:hypothetical protein
LIVRENFILTHDLPAHFGRSRAAAASDHNRRPLSIGVGQRSSDAFAFAKWNLSHHSGVLGSASSAIDGGGDASIQDQRRVVGDPPLMNVSR